MKDQLWSKVELIFIIVRKLAGETQGQYVLLN